MRFQAALLLLPLVVLACAAPSSAKYSYQTYFRAFSCPVANDTIDVSVTLPIVQGKARNEKFPVVLFVNGFVLRSCVYAPYAQRLAAAGYGVLQYDDKLNPRSDFEQCFNDATREGWMDEVLQCTLQQVAFRDNLDFNSVSVVGHSRGGKLAGLYFAGNPGKNIKTAYLIDPIDTPKNDSKKCMSRTPGYDPATFPNLADKLEGLEVPIGISGTALTSKCNCNSSNYQEIWDSTPPGSWLTVLKQAGHLQVTDDTLSGCQGESLWERLLLRTVYTDPSRVPIIGKFLAGYTCAKGPISSADAIDLVARPMLAWLDLVVKKQPSPDFQAWIDEQTAKGAIEFIENKAGKAAAVDAQR